MVYSFLVQVAPDGAEDEEVDELNGVDERNKKQRFDLEKGQPRVLSWVLCCLCSVLILSFLRSSCDS